MPAPDAESSPTAAAKRAMVLERAAEDHAREKAEVARSSRRRAVRVVALAPCAVLVVVAIVASALAGPIVGAAVALIAAGGCLVGLWWGSAPLVLRALHATPLDDRRFPRAGNVVDGLCASMGLAVPAMWCVESHVPIALALGRGRRRADLVLTSALAASTDPLSLEAVLAHELSHVEREETSAATLAAAMALLLPSGPEVAGRLVHRLAGRGREFEADRWAIGVTRYPPALRNALAASIEAEIAAADRAAEQRAMVVTGWLWTCRPGGAASAPVRELDDPLVRVAALDEY